MVSTPSAPRPPSGEDQPSSAASFFTVFPSIMLPMFLAIVDQTIVAAALPAIAGTFGSVDRISWVVVAYLVATTIAAPVYGRLGDLLGRKRLLLLALGLFMVASILCALSVSMEMLTVMRVLQGLGGGGLMTLSQALVGETVPPRERARYQGYLAAVAVSSSTFGPVAGGFLTQHFGWQSVFLVNLPIGLIAALLVRRLPQRAGSGAAFRFDFPGVFLFAVFIGSALVLLQEMQHLDEVALPVVLGLGLTILVSLVLLVRRESRTADPLLPLPLLRHPSIWRSDALAACHGAVLVSLMTFLPIYLRVVHGASSAAIGVLLLPMTIGVGIGSLVTGRTVSRTGRTAIFPSCGLVVVLMGMVALGVWSPRMTTVELSWFLGLVAIFMGTVMGVVQVTVQSAAGAGMLGTAAASVQFSRALGAALGTATVGAVLFAAIGGLDTGTAEIFRESLRGGSDALAALPEQGRAAVESEIAGAFRAAFLTISGFAAVATVLAWTIPMRRI